MNKSDIKRVVLAYSGGLLKENYNNCEVIAVSGNVGQADELEGLEEKAKKTGASKLYVLDLTDEYVDDYIIPCMKAGAVYEDYLLGTSHARPCIAKGLVEIALKEGADAIVHGCTGKGNDQVRFELAIKHFAPNMPIIAPWREWSIKSRDEEIDYAATTPRTRTSGICPTRDWTWKTPATSRCMRSRASWKWVFLRCRRRMSRLM